MSHPLETIRTARRPIHVISLERVGLIVLREDLPAVVEEVGLRPALLLRDAPPQRIISVPGDDHTIRIFDLQQMIVNVLPESRAAALRSLSTTEQQCSERTLRSLKYLSAIPGWAPCQHSRFSHLPSLSLRSPYPRARHLCRRDRRAWLVSTSRTPTSSSRRRHSPHHLVAACVGFAARAIRASRRRSGLHLKVAPVKLRLYERYKHDVAIRVCEPVTNTNRQVGAARSGPLVRWKANGVNKVVMLVLPDG